MPRLSTIKSPYGTLSAYRAAMVIVALASILTQPLPAFALRGHISRGARAVPRIGAPLRPHIGTPLRPRGAPLARALTTHNFRGHAYRGRLAWNHGRWHHAMRNGLLGWWWDVGGIWYYYPEQFEGPPEYVSDTEVAVDEPPAPSPPAPGKPRYVFYYRPGDLKGTPYKTMGECSQARQQAGDIGICVIK